MVFLKENSIVITYSPQSSYIMYAKEGGYSS